MRQQLNSVLQRLIILNFRHFVNIIDRLWFDLRLETVKSMAKLLDDLIQLKCREESSQSEDV